MTTDEGRVLGLVVHSASKLFMELISIVQAFDPHPSRNTAGCPSSPRDTLSLDFYTI